MKILKINSSSKNLNHKVIYKILNSFNSSLHINLTDLNNLNNRFDLKIKVLSSPPKRAHSSNYLDFESKFSFRFMSRNHINYLRHLINLTYFQVEN